MRIELTIKTDYLPDWGAYEGIRELVQNGHDAKTEFGASFTVRHRAPSTLVIENEGCTLPHEALLFGHTTKAARSDTIGKFGEGLKIRSGPEVWVPTIAQSDKFDASVLVFDIQTGRKPENRVQVEIDGVTKEEWKEFEKAFLFLRASGGRATDTVRTGHGALLLAPEYRGRVYVKGIFVQHKGDLAFGYDLDTNVDRDRRLVASWDLEYATQGVWREALHTRPDLVDPFFSLLETESSDVKGFEDYGTSCLPDGVKDAAAARFTDRFGHDAIPVATLAESAEVEHLGKVGIVTSKPLRKVLETRLGTTDENKARLAKEVVRFVGWHELGESERANLERAIALVNESAPVTLADVDVAEFRNPALMGLFSPNDDRGPRVRIAHRVLASRAATLEVIVHETAHKVGGSDGEKSHVADIERIWSGIVEKMSGGEN
jgi:hypothetical protein